MIRYITHPQVRVDPSVEVTLWGLSIAGRHRAQEMCAQSWVNDISRIVSSPETKALETAAILAQHCDVSIEVRPNTAENSRDSTGFVPPTLFESLADEFFRHPERSVRGWETALEAQTRITRSLSDLIAPDEANGNNLANTNDYGDNLHGDIAIIGHGAVGTLLYCQLAGVAVDRKFDQPYQGHYFTYDESIRRVVHPWTPIEEPAPPAN